MKQRADEGSHTAEGGMDSHHPPLRPTALRRLTYRPKESMDSPRNAAAIGWAIISVFN